MTHREFPVSHEGSTVSLRALCGDRLDAPDSPSEVSRSLRRYLVEYCERYGYRLVRTFVELEAGDRRLTTSAAVTLTATVEARYDDRWGAVRRALEEDGLLRPSDRADAPAGFWGWGDPDSVRTAFGSEPMRSPATGDLWYDIRKGRLHVYGDDGWARVTVPDPDPEPVRSMYEGVWTTDEICVRPEITGAVDGPTVTVFDPGGAKTLAAGDTLSWTETVTLTAD